MCINIYSKPLKIISTLVINLDVSLFGNHKAKWLVGQKPHGPKQTENGVFLMGSSAAYRDEAHSVSENSCHLWSKFLF